jgi:hypothetical protein
LPSIVAQALRFLYPCCVQVSLSLPMMPLAAVSGKSRLCVLESVLEPITGVMCQRRFSLLGRGDYSYNVELYASAAMLRFRKKNRFCLKSEISFEVSFGDSPLVTAIHETDV